MRNLTWTFLESSFDLWVFFNPIWETRLEFTVRNLHLFKLVSVFLYEKKSNFTMDKRGCSIWLVGLWYPFSSFYIYKYIYNWHVNLLSNFHVHIYTCWYVFSLFIHFFFTNLLFFFKEEKDLPFLNMCWPSLFAKTNLISG